MKRKIITIISIIIILVITIFLSSGFRENTSVVIIKHTVNNNKMSLETTLISSIGYTRGYKIKKDNDSVYLTFYNTFGFINSSHGAKSKFQLELDKNVTKIYINRANNKYELVLQKDEITNEWIIPK